MESVKCLGLDVHQSTISVAVLNAEGKLLMQSVMATQATAVLDLYDVVVRRFTEL